MGTYEDLKAAIQQVIRINGNNEITGALLQQTLLSIVNSVGANAAFAGIATPNTNPGTADQNVFYLAIEEGIYANFGGIEIAEGEAVILSNKTGNWTKTISGFSTLEGFNLLNTKTADNVAWENVSTSGEYISYASAYVNQELFSVARGTLKAGQTLKIYAAGYEQNVAMIAVQSGDTYSAKVISIDSTTRQYFWQNTSLEDVQIAVSYWTRFGLVAYVDNGYKPLVNMSYGEITNNYYIDYTTGNIIGFNGLKYITFGVVPGMRLIYKYKVDVLDARGLAFYDSKNNFIQGYQTTAEQQNIIVPENAVICRATVNNKEDVVIYAYNQAIADLKKSIENQNSTINILTAFDNLVCVGDSLTYSQVYTSQNGSRQARVTYPEALARLCGNEQTTLARAGASASSCWAEFGGQVVAKENGLAIIYLGTNLGITDTLDADVVGTEPDNWADNNIGDYCRFVNKFQTLGYKVLLLNIWATSGTGNANLLNTQNAIRHIAERFNCAVMDVPVTHENTYHYYPDLTGTNGVHYNDLGYSWFASQLVAKTGQLPEEQMKLLIPNA